jgi:hypothetical protein
MKTLGDGDAFVARFADHIKSAPLGVYDASRDAYKLIPAAMTPVTVSDSIWKLLAEDSQHVLSVMKKAIAWLRRPEQAKLAQMLFNDLAPIEKTVVNGSKDPDFGLATVRLDLFFDNDDLKIIEVNTTIPAMQAYTDMIKNAYANAKLAEQGRSPSDVNLQSNVSDLLASLLTHYNLAGGKKAKPRIAVVSRQGDSQTAELLWLQKKWREAGHECILAQPEDIVVKGETLYVKDIDIDLTYRHIFASRLAVDSPFLRACVESRKHRIFNPIAAHLEIKGLLAVVSWLASDAATANQAALTAPECTATQNRVPWTRLIQGGPATIVNGDKVPDLLSWLKTHHTQLVLKRSSGYGGHEVVIGDNFLKPEEQVRVAKIMGTNGPVDWKRFVEYCSREENGVWIVQQRVPGKIIHSRYLADDKIIETDAYVDCSMFASTGIPFQVGGGACRLSPDPIVNIGRGGGLVPFLLQSEQAQLKV